VKAALWSTPRPVPSRVLPAAGGALVLALALLVFLVAGFPVAGWAVGAVLWVALLALDLLLQRAKASAGNLAASGVQAFGLFFKATGLLAVLLALAVSHPHLAVAAAVTYVLAYTFELGLSLVTYFGGSSR
jgi:hypothetical protein